jgi:hypothetical protein
MLTKQLVILTTINYIMKKTQQPTKCQRYNRLTEENISNIVERKNPWVEARLCGRLPLITPAI